MQSCDSVVLGYAKPTHRGGWSPWRRHSCGCCCQWEYEYLYGQRRDRCGERPREPDTRHRVFIPVVTVKAVARGCQPAQRRWQRGRIKARGTDIRPEFGWIYPQLIMSPRFIHSPAIRSAPHCRLRAIVEFGRWWRWARRTCLARKANRRRSATWRGCGFRILDRNWRCADGEIDIVAVERHTFVVCEVKTRSGTRYGTPARRGRAGEAQAAAQAGRPVAVRARHPVRPDQDRRARPAARRRRRVHHRARPGGGLGDPRPRLLGGARRRPRPPDRGGGRHRQRAARDDPGRPAGHGAARGAGPDPRGDRQQRGELAELEDHRRPLARGAAQARLRLRPGHRGGHPGRRRGGAGRRARREDVPGRTGPRRAAAPGARGPARGGRGRGRAWTPWWSPRRTSRRPPWSPASR